ncbi:hypothetical protein B4589_015610 (plasmid) [Halolamina sp. CBA1230]|uniref:hypothetical protein n=1 Tax=Halolamina sp. CBA1230 TaxID=1853690 RepID=UPI00117A8BDF|nr:hypothetical protein [Halolamina sp. CBA1230]QKY21846.1 hypothetical protein B4589_015610 [Halolamina sp. CBA1230]
MSTRHTTSAAAAQLQTTPDRDPLYDPADVEAAIRRASNSDRVVPLLEGNWQESSRDYDSAEQAGRALIFDLAWWCDYRYSQVRRMAREAGLGQLFSGEEIDDIIDDAWEEQDDSYAYPVW